MMRDLPDQVWQREQNQNGHACRASFCPEETALGAEKQADEQRGEEKCSRVLVFDAEAAEQAEEQPGAGAG